ncbi:RICIN domain-containing protein [Streptomyces ortus]|uniref:Ricin-type beta-trefoil lectin domain protein n=1 Tax=Streptomyces ortus TaxID=2867268 RepID=A0ABT3VFE5_9ACTN|nr:ricin-type beta-trefoil lectin domain protein [Streptomyces ortus]MCX4237375.1 ricin-type beta-trefoil lectin domain protein [Streptomyces ortus]
MSEEIDGVRPVAALLARHGPSLYDYAEICAAGSAELSRMLGAEAFRQVVQDLVKSGSVGAIRPRLLLAVREAERARCLAERSEEGSSGILPTRTMSTGGRSLAHTAFMMLPRVTQYVLWHTEVEAEPPTVTAALLGIESGLVRGKLDRAREQLRAALLRAHADGSDGRPCRNYSRLLDASPQRGGSLLVEVQVHLEDCTYCRIAAEQLELSFTEPGVLLAEALLGGDAQSYLVACRRRVPSSAAGGPEAVRTRDGHFQNVRAPGGISKGGPHAARRISPRIFAVGIAAGAAVVVAALLVAVRWSDEAAEPTDTQPPRGTGVPSSPAAPSTARPVTPQGDRLRNAAADLCMDIRGGAARRGADITLSVCSAARTQQWTSTGDGLLRNLAQPDLCLDTGGDDEVVDLEPCDSEGNGSFGLRFDLTRDGQLLMQDEGKLSVAPVSPDAGAVVVAVPRNNSPDQKWLVESGT